MGNYLQSEYGGDQIVTPSENFHIYVSCFTLLILFAVLYRLFVFPFAESDQLLYRGIHQLQLIMSLLSLFAAMSQRRQIFIGRYVFSFVVCSCFLIMHCFCDCFTNTNMTSSLSISTSVDPR